MAYLIEPIHQNENLKSQLAKKDFRFEDERQDFPGVEVNAWLYWMRRLVDDGKARILKGDDLLPTLDAIDYTPPNRLAPRPKRGPARLREIFQSHPDVAAQYTAWTEDKRKSWEQLVGV